MLIDTLSLTQGKSLKRRFYCSNLFSILDNIHARLQNASSEYELINDLSNILLRYPKFIYAGYGVVEQERANIQFLHRNSEEKILEFISSVEIAQSLEALKRKEVVQTKVYEFNKIILNSPDEKNVKMIFVPVSNGAQLCVVTLIIEESKRINEFEKYFLEEISKIITNYLTLVHLKQKKLFLEAEQFESHEKILYSFIELIELRDNYTAGHCVRVARYASLIGEAMGLSNEEVDTLYKAGMVHDIGKVVIPDSILLKPGKYTDDEYLIIKEHVEMGYQILSRIDIHNDLAEIVLAHHEKYDGSGYPYGLKADQIPMLSHVLMVADAYDAMTTKRIYREDYDTVNAINELQSLSGIHYHPDVIEAACKVLVDTEIFSYTSQEPKNVIEQERVSYHFRDYLTGLYNHNFLDYFLFKLGRISEYEQVHLVCIDNFSAYNEAHGWSQGDQFLQDFSKYLSKTFCESMIFRIQGDDFLLLCKKGLDLENGQLHLFLEERECHDVYFTLKSLNLNEIELSSIHDFENYID